MQVAEQACRKGKEWKRKSFSTQNKFILQSSLVIEKKMAEVWLWWMAHQLIKPDINTATELNYIKNLIDIETRKTQTFSG